MKDNPTNGHWQIEMRLIAPDGRHHERQIAFFPGKEAARKLFLNTSKLLFEVGQAQLSKSGKSE